jgi:hypothetical protein
MHDITMDKSGILKKILPEASLQIVKNRHLIAMVKKRSCNMAADIARATNNQNFHNRSVSMIVVT